MENIVRKKRRKQNGTFESGGERAEIEDDNFENGNGRSKNKVDKKKKRPIKINDRVKIKTSKFGIVYARGRPEFTYGRVLKTKGKIYDVLWDGNEEDALMKTHVRHLILQSNLKEVDENEDEPRLFGKLTNETILPILSVGEALCRSRVVMGKKTGPRISMRRCFGMTGATGSKQ